MADETQTPDLQAAGVPTPQETLSQSAVMQALQPRGPMPGNVMQALQSAPVSPGLGFGSGVLAAIGGHPGQNPYLQQQQQGQGQQVQMLNTLDQMAHRQQLEVQRQQELQERVQARKEDRAFRQDQAILGIGKDLLNNESPEARLVGGKVLGGFLGKLGHPGGDELVKALATKKASSTELADMFREANMGLPPEMIAQRHPNVDPTTIQHVMGNFKSDAVRKTLGLPTSADDAKKTLDIQMAEANLLAKQHPELQGDAKTTMAVRFMHRKMFDGRDYMDGDGQSQLAAYDAVRREQDLKEEQKRDFELTKLQTGKQADLERALAVVGARINGQSVLKPMTGAEMTRAQKVIGEFQRPADTTKAIDQLLQQVDKMDNLGALPKGEDVASQLAAKFKRATLMRGNPEIFKFQQLWGPVSIGQIDRGMFDEKGVRAISAFSKQLDAVDNMPPAAALKSYLTTIKSMLLENANNKILNLEGLGERPEILNQARTIYGAMGGTPIKAGPLTGKAQHRYNPTTGQLEPIQ